MVRISVHKSQIPFPCFCSSGIERHSFPSCAVCVLYEVAQLQNGSEWVVFATGALARTAWANCPQARPVGSLEAIFVSLPLHTPGSTGISLLDPAVDCARGCFRESMRIGLGSRRKRMLVNGLSSTFQTAWRAWFFAVVPKLRSSR